MAHSCSGRAGSAVALVFDTRFVLLFVFSSFTLYGAPTTGSITVASSLHAGATPQVTGSPRGERIIDEIGNSIPVGRVHGTYRNGGTPSRGASLTTLAAVGRFRKRAARLDGDSSMCAAAAHVGQNSSHFQQLVARYEYSATRRTQVFERAGKQRI